MRFAETSFRSGSSRAIAVITSMVSLSGLAGFIATADFTGLARYGWGLLLAIAIAVALFWFPQVQIAADEVTVRNIFRTFHVPWGAIQRVDTKYSLTLITPHRTISAWATPAPNRYAASAASPKDASIARGGGRSTGGSIRPGDLPTSTSGAAAFLIRRHLEDLHFEYVSDGAPQKASVPAVDVTVETHWKTMVCLALLASVTAVGIFI